MDVDRDSIFETARRVDPRTAKDIGYAAKCWLTDRRIAIRPWAVTPSRSTCRIIGWSVLRPTSIGEATIREISIEAGEPLNLTGRIIAERRCSRGGKIATIYKDAAEGREDPIAAYHAWLTERLVDVMPYAEIVEARIMGYSHERTWRKVTTPNNDRRIVRERIVPVVKAAVTLRPRDVAGVEAWLAKGVGPQKAFGYGGFFPC